MEAKRYNFSGAIIGVLVVLLSLFAANRIVKSRKPPEQRPAVIQAPLVNAAIATAFTGKTVVSGNGVVESHNRLQIVPEVAGVITAIHDDLVAGGAIREGETILQIDQRDYRAMHDEALAALERARFELTMEEGRQVVARREWELLKKEGASDTANRDLALRVPHLKERQAALKAAEARVATAESNLQRTTLKAPFNALVLSENIALGQAVSPAQTLGELVGIDEFRVAVSLPLDQLHRIRIPEGDQTEGARARVIQRKGDGALSVRDGRVAGLSASLDRQSRMARVYLTVSDPMSKSVAQGPLLLDSYVRVEIETDNETGLVQIPREALHELEQVWVIGDNNTLEPRAVTIVHRDDRHIWISGGVAAGERLLTSSLRSLVAGMPVRVREEIQDKESLPESDEPA